MTCWDVTMSDKKSKEEVQECLNPQCNNKAVTRGLCNTCYTMARRLIRKGVTSNKWLVANGKMLEANHNRPNKGAWLLKGTTEAICSLPENYWKTRCELAERFIDCHTGDPDLTSEMIDAYSEWDNFKDQK